MWFSLVWMCFAFPFMLSHLSCINKLAEVKWTSFFLGLSYRLLGSVRTAALLCYVLQSSQWEWKKSASSHWHINPEHCGHIWTIFFWFMSCFCDLNMKYLPFFIKYYRCDDLHFEVLFLFLSQCGLREGLLKATRDRCTVLQTGVTQRNTILQIRFPGDH